MKKIIASAVGIVMVGGVAVTTASAVESQFGGYWRTRIFSQSNFDGQGANYWRADNRTRLYYTAKFNDDFKFVNKFEHNTSWGDDTGGDIGADGMGIFRIKNSYADFTLGNVNTRLGIQANVLARGFIFDDDFSGALITYNSGDISVPFMWARVDGEYVSDAGRDEDIYSLTAKVNVGDMGKVSPYVVYHGANNDSDLAAFYLGVDADLKFDEIKTWGSFIYQGGTAENNDDNGGYLFALGGSFNIVHGQFFYASGDDSPFDGDNDAFLGAPGNSYYWSEIMGLGTFDNQAAAGGPGNNISNVYAFNVGVKMKPADKWTLSGDLWYANLAEDNVRGEDELGTEIDLKATYAVMDNLNLDLIAAYLFAGDATSTDIRNNDDDPVEFGARLSLSF